MSWTPPEPTWPEDAVEVGRVTGPWGIKGWIKVQPYAGDPQALFSSRRWFLQPPERLPAAAATAFPPLLKITAAREHGDGVVASAQEVPDRNAAEALKGARVFVSRASFPTAEEGEYYWVDLIGLDVVNREGVALGTVTDLLATGPHSVLRIKPKEVPAGMTELEAERLIPFVAAYIDQVDLVQKRITVDWGADY
ncbi:ribosome maturation factor RimM [Azohydromonas lata]|uniref:Ribosome maturation factor RimM n=1 Tax=Azohydromonas lata TaxID=45677 RepID=A0ABU5IJM3_9BURK|nr:ribosome maturation factor RimM [Azohydromonas lata]MDZ5459101.1 ribosome maturation factor RimM [Azohydromonas lata]